MKKEEKEIINKKLKKRNEQTYRRFFLAAFRRAGRFLADLFVAFFREDFLAAFRRAGFLAAFRRAGFRAAFLFAIYQSPPFF